MRHRFPKIHLKSRNTIADTKLVILNRYSKINIVDLQRNKKDFLLKKQTLKSFPQQNQNSIPWISYTHILTTKAYI